MRVWKIKKDVSSELVLGLNRQGVLLRENLIVKYAVEDEKYYPSERENYE